MQADTKFDRARGYYLRVPEHHFQGRETPPKLINCYRKKGFIECQTLYLVKCNQRLNVSDGEIISQSDKAVQALLEDIRKQIAHLFRACEAIAMLDMLAGFAEIATHTNGDYTRPEFKDTMCVEAGRHPIREKVAPSCPCQVTIIIFYRFILANTSQTMFTVLGRNASRSLRGAT